MTALLHPTHLSHVDEAELGELEGLLRALHSGNRAASGLFFDRYQQQVNSLVWALLGADAEHDDLVNAAFELMLRNIKQVRSPHALKGWVRTVTINTVRLEFRRRKWRRLFTGEQSAMLAHADLSVADASQRERTRNLYRALESLDAGARVSLVLRHVEGYELTEVAATVGCSLATIKRRLEKAEARLAIALGASS